MTKNIKTSIFLITAITFSSALFAFEWPQEELSKESFNSYFGQNTANKLNTSIIFSEPSEIKAAENGHILAILTEETDDSMFFPSTLGTSVILSHDDMLLSVYANIDEDTLSLNDENETYIDSGAIIGSTGNSGYQTKKGNLEFQIIDTKNKTAINPKILMPRSEAELPLILSGITILSKDFVYYDINNVKTYNAGLYRIYFKRNKTACPYATRLTINGVVMDQITYDTISQENNKICVAGKKKYTSTDVYPNEDLQLIGESMFTPGRANLVLSISDALGNTKQVNYTISVK